MVIHKKSIAFVAALAFSTLGMADDIQSNSYRRLHQGKGWTQSDWKSFYSQDQGSRIMPYSWAVALKESNGEAFLRDSLSRYGYLSSPRSSRNPKGLPLGFLVADPLSESPQLSFTCAACHTRQFSVNGVNYRADGGPAFSDIYSFLKDLDSAVGYTLANQQAFAQFQQAVATQGVAPPSKDQLAAWYLPYNTLISNSLTSSTAPWGVSRMDAISMIENRAGGLDIGSPHDDRLIPSNIFPANVPVKYPFLWNAPKQDLTQWAGTTVNGNASYGLERNSGEVIGSFGIIIPQENAAFTNGYYLISVNSINFNGLLKLENLIGKIGPPKWPWKVDYKKAAKGKLIYDVSCGIGCHEIKPGEARPPVTKTWRTPVINVGTDNRYYNFISQTSSSSGILTGFRNPVDPLSPPIPATGVVSFNLVTILNQSLLTQKYPEINLTLKPPAPTQGAAFESRVLQGIWAAAPYLHNGSVPSLTELLKPAAERVRRFQVGPEYDVVNVGLAQEQPSGHSSVIMTTDCSNLNSGNSNCGHEFGTSLSPSNKDALLEYLKTL